jgi:hypothetical protein
MLSECEAALEADAGSIGDEQAQERVDTDHWHPSVGRTTQLDMPSGSANTPPAPLEASISCSPYMAVLSSDGRPATGIAAWTMLLISALDPGCAQWTVEQAAKRVVQQTDRAKREHDSFYAQLDRASIPY